MESQQPSGCSEVLYPANVSAPKFHLFQSVTVFAEHCPFPSDYGRIVGIAFDSDKHLQCQWWYVIEYPEGLESSPWLPLGHKDEVPESELTQLDIKGADFYVAECQEADLNRRHEDFQTF